MPSIKLIYASTALLSALMLLSSCNSDQHPLFESGKKDRNERATVYVPNKTNEYAKHDIQLKFDVNQAYLMSDFTWNPEAKVLARNFNINVDEVDSPPTREEVEKTIYSRILRVSLRMSEKGLLDVRANPNYDGYSPWLLIGDQPILDQKFGLDFRENAFFSNAAGPTNTMYSKVEQGHVRLVILCTQKSHKPQSERWCRMLTPLHLSDPKIENSEYAPFATIGFAERYLEDWRKIESTIVEFVEKRSTIVDFVDKRTKPD